MPQLILSVHSGVHDVGAAVFDDFPLERLTRYRALAKIRNRERVRFSAPMDMRGEF